MIRKIIVNDDSDEVRIAVLEDGELVEFHVERASESRIAGNVYKGVVSAVFPKMLAAFVDIGIGKNAFIQFDDAVMGFDASSDASSGNASAVDDEESLSAKNTLLKKGDELIVQVEREAIDRKGPRVSTHVSIPGKLMVIMPGIPHIGISRKIEDKGQRDELKNLVMELASSEKNGFIVRTAAVDAGKEEIKKDIDFLEKTWNTILRRFRESTGPALLYEEEGLMNLLLRDFLLSPEDSIIVDSRDMESEIRGFFSEMTADVVPSLKYFDENIPVFEYYGIEKDISKLLERRIWLKSGGVILIDYTEALVAIDVNTARSTGGKGKTDPIFRTNMEAAMEVARQVRLRDIGGIIVVDFIDMDSDEKRTAVMKELKKAFSSDRSRNRILDFSEFGLVQITRKRLGPNLIQKFTERCPACSGRGVIMTREAFAVKMKRVLKSAVLRFPGRDLLLKVHPSMLDAVLRILKGDPELQSRMGERGLAVESYSESSMDGYLLSVRTNGGWSRLKGSFPE